MSEAPEVVFFGGFTDTGAIGLRKAMVSSGHRNIPLLSWDGLFDGSGGDAGSYIQRTTAGTARKSGLTFTAATVATADIAKLPAKTHSATPSARTLHSTTA